MFIYATRAVRLETNMTVHLSVHSSAAARDLGHYDRSVWKEDDEP